MKRQQQNVMDQNEDKEETPRIITKNVRGQIRKYCFLKTVQSLEELEKLRFENNCCLSARKRFHTFKSFSLPCTMKSRGKGCKFHLLAVPSDLESGSTIHVYAYSHHNHPIKSEKERSVFRKTKELMPDQNPPMIFRTEDKMKWNYLQTFPDFEQMDKFRSINGCQFHSGREKRWRLRLYCGRKFYHKSCKFILLALKTIKNRYHVYQNGGHNHPILKKRQLSSKEQLEEEEDAEEERHQQRQQPQKKITKTIRGQQREYHYVKTLNTVGELDKIRSKNYCLFANANGKLPLHISKCCIMPCLKKRRGKICDFELMALPSKLKNGNIHIYSHSKHSDHPFFTEEERALIRKEKKIMPAENPPKAFRTADNIEWHFLQTFPNYDKMQQFRLQNQCKFTTAADANWCRLHHVCIRQSTHNCPFKLLAIKTTNDGYHFYTHGEHNHRVNTSNEKQQRIRDQVQQKRKQMDEEEGGEEEDEEVDDEESEEEDDNEDEDESEEDESEEELEGDEKDEEEEDEEEPIEEEQDEEEVKPLQKVKEEGEELMEDEEEGVEEKENPWANPSPNVCHK